MQELPQTLIRLASVASARYRLTDGYLAIDHVRGVYVLQAQGVSQWERLHCWFVLSPDIIKLCDYQTSAFLGPTLYQQTRMLDVIFICRCPDSVGRFPSFD